MKILIADDNADDRKMLKFNLEHHGCEVIEAADGKEGLAMAKAHNPGLIVSDALMPHMDGFQFLRSIKTNETLQSIPFIFYSAVYTGFKEAALAISLGAEAFIIKPKDPEEFWEELLGILEECKLKKEKTITAELIEEEEEFLRKYSHVVAAKLEEKVAELGKEIDEHKKAEEALYESQYAYKTLAENLPGLIYRVFLRENNRTQFFNMAAENITGYSNGELSAGGICSIDPLIVQEDRGAVISAVKLAISEKRHFSVEYQLRHKDGVIRHMLEQGTPVYGADGKPLYIDGVIFDISTHKESEQKIEFLASIVNNSTEAICSIDLSGNIITWNKGAENILGYKAEEIIGKPIAITIPPELAEKELAHCINILNTEGSFSGYESVRLTKDGRTIAVEVTAAALKDKEQNVTSYTSIIRDITERKKAEEELLFRNTLLSTQQEVSPDGILAVDENNKIISFNQRFIYMWGVPLEVVETKSDELALQAVLDKLKEPEQFLEKVKYLYLHKSETSSDEIYLKDGRIFDRYSAPMFGENAKYFGRVWNFRDITEHRRLEEQLLQSQKMEAIGQLAGGVAHDFNNILSAIIGYGDLAKMKMKEDDPFRENLDYMLEGADKAATLTRSLLAFSRKQAMDLRPLNLNETIRRIKKFLVRIIGEDIQLKAELSEHDLNIMADSGQLEQVLLNLSTNARDAMPGGGLLIIKSEKLELDDDFVKLHGFGKHGEYALFSVTDTGRGMDEATKEKIFEPFFTTKEIGKGTGLGLAMVYGIVKQHNGFINVYSEQGTGTTFNIYLPLIKEKTGKEETSVLPYPKGGTETILVAEDDDSLRKLIQSVLKSFGYRVITAEDGEDAITKFKENMHEIKLCILDMVMPKKNGKEACDEIRMIRPDIKVLFASGYTADIIQRNGIVKEDMDFVLKPVTPKNLMRKVREMLDR